MNQLKYRVLGVMSGTSLDGLDLCLVELCRDHRGWSYSIRHGETISYSEATRNMLVKAYSLSGPELKSIDTEYGHFLAERINSYLNKVGIRPDLIASHGHTVFHDPENKQTVQIGNGPEIYTITGIPTVCDFRVQDVLLGGHGAPLVPIGDALLFGKFTACLNLGGFANISFNDGQSRIAFDICPVNIVLNTLSQKLGQPFDQGGEWARSGKIDVNLLQQLNALNYYIEEPPKSLGREWVEQHIDHLIHSIDTKDALATFVEHVAIQVANGLSGLSGELLVTGGGAFNTFLMERIQYKCQLKAIIPERGLVNFKEALIFALLGALRWTGQANCLSSVTGAKTDHSSGRIYR